MSRKSKISYEVKIKSVQEYIAGEKRACDICEELNIRRESFHRWVSKYDTNGVHDEICVKKGHLILTSIVITNFLTSKSLLFEI